MLSVEKCRKLLGKNTEGLSDEAIEQIRGDLYVAANLAFTRWQESHVQAKESDIPSPFVNAQPVFAEKQ